jgi:CRP-like cAMP-binding protein
MKTLDKAIRELVTGHPFFKHLNSRYIHLLTDCAELVRFGPGEDIFREGQEADRLYLIHKGRVSLETFVPRMGATTVQTLGAGGALGWSWLYAPHRWQFSARALEPVEAIAFSAVSLREKIEENHDFGYDLLLRIGRVILERLQNTRRKLVEFYVGD